MLLIVLNIVLNFFVAGNQPAAVFENEVGTFLRQTYTEYNDIEYRVEDDLSEYIDIEINYRREPNRIGSIFYVPVTAKLTDGDIKERFVKVNLKIYEKVLFATQTIPAGDPVNSSNSEFRRTDITEFRTEPLTEKNVTESYITRYDLRPNTIITTNQIERQPVIEAGARIKALYKRGTVLISFDGVARQSGAEGDLIKVKANNTQYSARVINSKQVNIIE